MCCIKFFVAITCTINYKSKFKANVWEASSPKISCNQWTRNLSRLTWLPWTYQLHPAFRLKMCKCANVQTETTTRRDQCYSFASSYNGITSTVSKFDKRGRNKRIFCIVESGGVPVCPFNAATRRKKPRGDWSRRVEPSHQERVQYTSWPHADQSTNEKSNRKGFIKTKGTFLFYRIFDASAGEPRPRRDTLDPC